MRLAAISISLLLGIASALVSAQEVTTVAVADNIYMLQSRGGKNG